MVRMTERPAGFGKPQTTSAGGYRHNTARPRCRWIAWLRRRRGPDLNSCRRDLRLLSGPFVMLPLCFHAHAHQKKIAKIAMPRGSNPGERRGGRERGTPNKNTALMKVAFAAAASDVGLTPLEFM